VFGSDCVMVILSLITCFPSLTRHSQTGSQADKICQYIVGVSTINSAVSSQPLYNLSPSYNTHCFSSAIFLSTCPGGKALIVSYEPADTTISSFLFWSKSFYPAALLKNVFSINVNRFLSFLLRVYVSLPYKRIGRATARRFYS